MAIENLVLEGCGLKGLAFLGALKALDEKKQLDQLKNVAGSSAVGITAMLLALGLTPDQIIDICSKIDLSSLFINGKKMHKGLRSCLVSKLMEN